ncbi:ABC transporter permease [Thermodesulfobacteriota bacterium]
MLPLRFFPLIFKYVIRHRTRSLLTMGGIAIAMFMFHTVQATQQGVEAATQKTAEDTTLVVYRQDRYCPYTSNLPQSYASQISRIPGVKGVVPIKIAVNNCRTSLDVITFRGVPAKAFEKGMGDHVTMLQGSLDNWNKRTDSALLGERLAKRRSLKVGDQVKLAGIPIQVGGIFQSPEPQDQNVAYAHIDYIQRSGSGKVGIVTQFNVKVDDPGRMDSVAKAIDAEFATAQTPTSTWAEKAFVGRAVGDIVEIVRFAQLLGWGAIACIFALVGNAIALSVRERVRDHAVMQTLGYMPGLIAQLVIAEGLVLSLCGSIVGLAGAVVLTHWRTVSLSVEGLSINVHAGASTILMGIGLSALVGILAGMVPAWQASHQEPVESFRAV